MLPGIRSRLLEVMGKLTYELGVNGVSGKEVLSAGVEPEAVNYWQVPPLKPYEGMGDDLPSILTGQALMEDVPERMHPMYQEYLHTLLTSPSHIRIDDSHGLPFTLMGKLLGMGSESGLLFSLPAQVSGVVPVEGVVLAACEVAAFLMNVDSEAPRQLSADSFCVTVGGFTYGVQDFKVAGIPQNIQAGKHFRALLELPRGVEQPGESLDAIERLKFWADNNYDRVANIPGLTDYLSMLRWGATTAMVDAYYRHLWGSGPKRARAGRGLRTVEVTATEKLAILSEAQAIMQSWRLTDSERLYHLMSLLVPRVVDENWFTRRICDYTNGRFRITSKKHEARINNNLAKLAEKIQRTGK